MATEIINPKERYLEYLRQEINRRIINVAENRFITVNYIQMDEELPETIIKELENKDMKVEKIIDQGEEYYEISW